MNSPATANRPNHRTPIQELGASAASISTDGESQTGQPEGDQGKTEAADRSRYHPSTGRRFIVHPVERKVAASEHLRVTPEEGGRDEHGRTDQDQRGG